MASIPHPLSALSIEETNAARDVILAAHKGSVLQFRHIYLLEPPKSEVVAFLELEHAGKVTADTPRPVRTAQVSYDVIGGEKSAEYHETIVDLRQGKVVGTKIVDQMHQASLILAEFDDLAAACKESTLFQEKIAALELPEKFEVVVEPWPYGAPDVIDGDTRMFQALIFARDTSSGNPDTNFYAFPLPLIPVMDARTKKIVRIDELATGGKGDPLTGKTHKPAVLEHCAAAEYVPELLPGGTRDDLKPLTVVQPDGPSFTVTDGNLIKWQKWQLRVTFNPREGAVLHDIRFDDRSIMYRLSMSDMTVPYADPRTPFHRKQAFDFGDGGLGNAVNNLTLGCDCLGVIKYFDGVLTDASGTAQPTKNVICLHEQDNGIGWKHTNWRTGRAVVTRRRELVLQFIITLANYEYVFNFKLDQAAGITVESRATGIVSVVNIDPGKTSPWGNVVSPGALAQNHQHIFCVRIDPAIDGHQNTVVQEESLPVRMDKRTNPNGNYYEVQQTPITTSVGLDVAPFNHRVFKIQNTNKLNPISGKPVSYKITPPATQLLLADPGSTQAKRALFAKHHLWVTKYKDDELYAGGRYTLMSKREIDGVSDAAARNDDILNEDVVVWSVFGLTHNPRIEDWPVMPVEVMQLNITPSDFFTRNPAIDVPSDKDIGSKATNGCCS
ncbi:copper amine oxidase [Plectosphaerella cucumerina]|uniref:Amine oxidase n=1 Tax=Plectosphaerella cucumerina TaxID=40658 RepID=A0A8K0X807_9PEZI|nr:copper amine oxidase [Plectosphaerella cucumerina]